MLSWHVVLLVAGVVLADVEEDPNEIRLRLETEINRVRDEKSKQTESAEDKMNELDAISQKFKQQIYNLNLNRLNTSAETAYIMNDTKILYVLLAELYPIEENLTEELLALEKDKKRLDLAIKWLNQDIDIYKKRQEDNDDDKCFDLKEVIVVKQKRRSLNVSNRSAQDYIFILQNTLSQAEISLRGAESINRQLDLKINEAVSFKNSQVQELAHLLQSVCDDKKSAEEMYYSLKTKKERIENNIQKLRDDIEKLNYAIEQDLDVLRQIKLTLYSFKEAVYCYNSTEDDALRRAKPIELPIDQ